MSSSQTNNNEKGELKGWSRYCKVRELGQGAMGVVYLALDLTIPSSDDPHHHVAIKCVSLHGSSEAESAAALREVAIMSNLSHPNIVRYLDCFIDHDEALCIVTEFVDGGDLSDMITRCNKQAASRQNTNAHTIHNTNGGGKNRKNSKTSTTLSIVSQGNNNNTVTTTANNTHNTSSSHNTNEPPEFFGDTPTPSPESTATNKNVIKEQQNEKFHVDAIVIVDISEQILKALAYLQRQNIVHRDLKPSNVFITANGVCKLGDFGVSRIINKSMSQTRSFVGSPFYLSPEMAMGSKYSFPADIWSFGVTLYELYTGEVPFNARNVLALINRITEGKYDIERLKCRPYKSLGKFSAASASAAAGATDNDKKSDAAIDSHQHNLMASMSEQVQKEVCTAIVEMIQTCLVLEPSERFSARNMLLKYFTEDPHSNSMNASASSAAAVGGGGGDQSNTNFTGTFGTQQQNTNTLLNTTNGFTGLNTGIMPLSDDVNTSINNTNTNIVSSDYGEQHNALQYAVVATLKSSSSSSSSQQQGGETNNSINDSIKNSAEALREEIADVIRSSFDFHQAGHLNNNNTNKSIIDSSSQREQQNQSRMKCATDYLDVTSPNASGSSSGNSGSGSAEQQQQADDEQEYEDDFEEDDDDILSCSKRSRSSNNSNNKNQEQASKIVVQENINNKKQYKNPTPTLNSSNSVILDNTTTVEQRIAQLPWIVEPEMFCHMQLDDINGHGPLFFVRHPSPPPTSSAFSGVPPPPPLPPSAKHVDSSTTADATQLTSQQQHNNRYLTTHHGQHSNLIAEVITPAAKKQQGQKKQGIPGEESSSVSSTSITSSSICSSPSSSLTPGVIQQNNYVDNSSIIPHPPPPPPPPPPSENVSNIHSNIIAQQQNRISSPSDNYEEIQNRIKERAMIFHRKRLTQLAKEREEDKKLKLVAQQQQQQQQNTANTVPPPTGYQHHQNVSSNNTNNNSAALPPVIQPLSSTLLQQRRGPHDSLNIRVPDYSNNNQQNNNNNGSSFLPDINQQQQQHNQQQRRPSAVLTDIVEARMRGVISGALISAFPHLLNNNNNNNNNYGVVQNDNNKRRKSLVVHGHHQPTDSTGNEQQGENEATKTIVSTKFQRKKHRQHSPESNNDNDNNDEFERSDTSSDDEDSYDEEDEEEDDFDADEDDDYEEEEESDLEEDEMKIQVNFSSCTATSLRCIPFVGKLKSAYHTEPTSFPQFSIKFRLFTDDSYSKLLKAVQDHVIFFSPLSSPTNYNANNQNNNQNNSSVHNNISVTNFNSFTFGTAGNVANANNTSITTAVANAIIGNAAARGGNTNSNNASVNNNPSLQISSLSGVVGNAVAAVATHGGGDAHNNKKKSSSKKFNSSCGGLSSTKLLSAVVPLAFEYQDTHGERIIFSRRMDWNCLRDGHVTSDRGWETMVLNAIPRTQ